jgi:predicted membrane channel-forming protein YqfA (hemolysin III family)
MMKPLRTKITSPLIEHPETLGEEIANAISHGIGFLLAVLWHSL